MTTTDPFTDAARAEAEELTGPPVAGETSWDYRYLFEAGAEWARTHLAQEPDGAEVEAAQAEVALHQLILVKPGVIRCHCGAPGFWGTPEAHEQHVLWHALRAARRDEEKR